MCSHERLQRKGYFRFAALPKPKTTSASQKSRSLAINKLLPAPLKYLPFIGIGCLCSMQET